MGETAGLVVTGAKIVGDSSGIMCAAAVSVASTRAVMVASFRATTVGDGLLAIAVASLEARNSSSPINVEAQKEQKQRNTKPIDATPSKLLLRTLINLAEFARGG